MFYQMIHADSLRGFDATGVITCHNNGDFGIMKDASEGTYFNAQFISSDLDKDLYKNGTAVIGHNRAKTFGENTDENAHPFVVDKTFAMVHNGTLRNHKKIADTSVDSEALAILFKQAMDEEDFVKALSEAVWKVEGAFACVWYDQKRNQVGMVRNSQRPLGTLELNGSIIFASEMMMASWIASRNTEKVLAFKTVPENTLCLYDLTKGGGSCEEFPLAQKPIATPVMIGGPKKTTVIGEPTNIHHFGVKMSSPTKNDPVGNNRCSKNLYKRLKRQLGGKGLIFVLDDWVEKHLNVEGNEYIILGTCTSGAYDLCEVKHTIRTVVNIERLGISLKELDFQAQWYGTVQDLTYDDKIGQVIIDMVKVTPVLEDISNETVH